MTRKLPIAPLASTSIMAPLNQSGNESATPRRQAPDPISTAAENELPDMATGINTVAEDLRDIEAFYHVSFSPARVHRIKAYLEEKMQWLATVPFEKLDRSGRVDFLLLQNYVKRQLKGIQVDHSAEVLLDPWSKDLLGLLAQRQAAETVDGKVAAGIISNSTNTINELSNAIESGKSFDINPSAAEKVVSILQELKSHFAEWFAFYNGYDPLITWWTRSPYKALDTAFTTLADSIRSRLVGVDSSDEDAIVGQPSGRESLLDDLEAEMIPYTPEELIEIGEREYAWCEKEMLAASKEMGFGGDWRAALEKVKGMYVPPGQQPQLVHDLSAEAIAYVKDRDMVTVPKIAEECIRTEMMSPARQKANPFFLGGPLIQVSYPTDTMTHEEKMMSVRGNSKPFSRSTVFHELIPGHHLQWYYLARYNTHRNLFTTPFWIEGWSFYWEMVLYSQGFPGSPENRIGMLFWRMHRCIRIIFSLRFHLGEISPQECIDMLVVRVGHERATAEGEVRRSFNGDYSPLYQAGYMLGALQFRKLREEVVETGKMGEREFHDLILKQGQMPVELARAMVKGEELERDGVAGWRFYDM